MIRIRTLMVIAVLASCCVALDVATAQDKTMPHLPAADGGVFVTPVPGAPFSAEVVRVMTQVLRDGSSFQRKTAATIARDSQGRIRNERHEVLPATSTRKPTLLSIHIYDPETRMSTLLNPQTHIARQMTLPNPPSTEPPGNWWMHAVGAQSSSANLEIQDLGSSVMEGMDVHGFRKIVKVAAKSSGTDRPVVVTDEVWYSDELHINLITKHNDPRTDQSTITVSQINPNEPDAELFAIPSDYKLVDVTPPETESANPVTVVE